MAGRKCLLCGKLSQGLRWRMSREITGKESPKTGDHPSGRRACSALRGPLPTPPVPAMAGGPTSHLTDCDGHPDCSVASKAAIHLGRGLL